MMKQNYNPRNRNWRYESAPLSWAQSYYERERPKPPIGFKEREQ